MVFVDVEISQPFGAEFDDADTVCLFNIHMKRIEVNKDVGFAYLINESKGLGAGIEQIGLVTIYRFQPDMLARGPTKLRTLR
jgi:hypothetical protein